MGVSIPSSNRFSTPWAQPPLKLCRSRYRRGFLWSVHLFAVTQLLFFYSVIPTFALIGVLVCIAVSGGYYRVFEPHLRPISLHYDGQQWCIGYPAPPQLPRIAWRCLSAPAVLGRLGSDKREADKSGLKPERTAVTVSAQLVREASTIYRTVLALVFESESGERFRIDVWRDQMTDDQYRRLYVLLNLGC